MKTPSLLTVTLIAGAILLVAGTSIEMAFAAQNELAPGQSFLGNPGQSGAAPPGQQIDITHSTAGNFGQCMKIFAVVCTPPPPKG